MGNHGGWVGDGFGVGFGVGEIFLVDDWKTLMISVNVALGCWWIIENDMSVFLPAKKSYLNDDILNDLMKIPL